MQGIKATRAHISAWARISELVDIAEEKTAVAAATGRDEDCAAAVSAEADYNAAISEADYNAAISEADYNAAISEFSYFDTAEAAEAAYGKGARIKL